MTGYEAIPIAGGDTAMPLNIRKRLAIISQQIRIAASTRFLDCGCGCGSYVRMLRTQFGIDAVGVEYLEHKVSEAKAQPDIAPFITQGDIEALPYGDEEFDAVLLNEVIEHIPDQTRGLAEIRRVLKMGGKLIIFAPNRLFPFETHGVYLRGSDFKISPWFPLIPYVPVGLGHFIFRYWARNYWPGQLRKLLTGSGFDIKQTDYVWQTFENISGCQPWIITRSKNFLRRVSAYGERSFLKCFGVSQILICQKVELAGVAA